MFQCQSILKHLSHSPKKLRSFTLIMGATNSIDYLFFEGRERESICTKSPLNCTFVIQEISIIGRSSCVHILFIYMMIKICKNPFRVFVSEPTVHGNGFQSLNLYDVMTLYCDVTSDGVLCTETATFSPRGPLHLCKKDIKIHFLSSASFLV